MKLKKEAFMYWYPAYGWNLLVLGAVKTCDGLSDWNSVYLEMYDFGFNEKDILPEKYWKIMSVCN